MPAIARVTAVTLGLALLARPGLAEPLIVNEIRFWSLGDVTRVAIEVSGPFHFRADRLDNPPRVFFDIPDSVPRMAPRGVHTIPVGDRLVRQVRVGENNQYVTRVVLDLEGPASFTTSELVNPHRLMVEVRAAGPAPVAPEPLAEAPKPQAPKTPPKVFVPPAPKPARQQPAALIAPPRVDPSPIRASSMTKLAVGAIGPPAPPPAPAVAAATAMPPVSSALPPVSSATLPPVPNDAVPTPAKRNLGGDRSMTRVLGLKIGRVVIDPGHGGHDAGTIGPKGLAEKDLVLDIAKRVGELIESRMSADVIYTRTDDRFIPLEARTELANEVRADLFLSIHANSSPLIAASGSETYYLNFTTSRADLDVAARENAGSQKSVFELKELLEKIALRDKVDESREFAGKVQSALYGVYAKNNPKLRNRGVKKAPFVVLIGASMPSILAEVGFVSNPREEVLLKRADYRQKVAEGLFKGLSAYAGTLSHFQVARRD